MKIVYLPSAIKDIMASADYIDFSLKNPLAAKRFKTKILQGISLLKENPNIGVPLKNKYEDLETECRFIVINKQLIFYEINGNIIEIVRVLDGRTDYLSILFE